MKNTEIAAQVVHKFSRQKLNIDEMKAITCYIYGDDAEVLKKHKINLTALVRDSVRQAARMLESGAGKQSTRLNARKRPKVKR